MASHRKSAMQRVPILLRLFLAFASLFLFTEGAQRSSVLELTADTVDSAIKKHDVIMVEFYAPWCGHCQRLAPEYERAAQILSVDAPQVTLAKIDADKYKAVGRKYELSGYPTLRLYTNGIPTEAEYEGHRSAEAIVSYVKSALVPTMSVISSETELVTFVSNVSDDLPRFFGFGLEDSALDDMAKKYRRRALFIILQNFSKKIMVDFDFDKKPALVCLHPKLEEHSVFYGPFEGSDDIDEFVKQGLMPLVSPVGGFEAVQRLRDDGRPIAIGVVDSNSFDTSKSFIKKLKAAAPANRAFVFAYVEATKWPTFVQPFGIDKSSVLPTVIIWDGESEFSNREDVEAFTGADAEAQLTKFLQDFKANKVTRRALLETSFLDRVKKIILGVPALFIIFAFVVLIFLLQGFNWSALTSDGNPADEHRDRSRRMDLEGDIVGDRPQGDVTEPLHLGRKSEKRD